MLRGYAANVVSHARYVTFPFGQGHNVATDVSGNPVAHRPAAAAAVARAAGDHSNDAALIRSTTDVPRREVPVCFLSVFWCGDQTAF